MIELAGLESSSVAALTGLPGALSVDGTADGTAARVASGASDDVLRQLLTWDGVHVTAVRTETADTHTPGAEPR